MMTYAIDFNTVHSWADGFIGEISLNNLTYDPIFGWVIEFDASFEISNIWNAEVVAQMGSRYIIRDAGWNDELPPNGSVSFGFQASYSGEIVAPSGFVVNDKAVGVENPPEPVLPIITVNDVSFSEGDNGTSQAVFSVSLSQASTEAVTVNYVTSDQTAVAGVDYDAASGSLTFAPGETTKDVSVTVISDYVVEPDETFQLNLSNVNGASIDDGTGVATILNDDSATLPVLSVAEIAITEGSSSTPGGNTVGGYFSTQGNQIVDQGGESVKIAGINWFGMESDRYAPDGLHTRKFQDMMDQMVELGFNTIRLPFSNQLFDPTSVPNGINYNLNPELAGLSGIQILDEIVEYAGNMGLRIILDHHRSAAGAGANENGLWYTGDIQSGQYSEQRWISDWTMLAERYSDNPTVIGADLHNEPHGSATWGGGGATDWAAAAERAGNAIHDVNSDWLIFVEGVGSYQGENYWWGGNLMGVRDRPVQLEEPNKLVYSPHDYPNSIYAQPWFKDAEFPDNLMSKFDEMWGYIYREGIAPVYLGEFGSKLTDPKDLLWLEKIQSYLAGDFNDDGIPDIPDGAEGISWTWWSWNPNSGDTGGILQDDWQSVNSNKVNALEALMFDFNVNGDSTGPGDYNQASFIVTLSEPFENTVSVDWEVLAGTATADDFIATTGSLTFEPGETSKSISVSIVPDTLVEGDEQFTLRFSNPVNVTIENFTVNAVILDDDTDAPAEPPVPENDDPITVSTIITNDWGSGFTASIELNNDDVEEIDDWTIQITMPYDILNIWDAEIVSHIGDTYFIRGATWNDDIGIGDEVSFGFQASPGNTNEFQFDWIV